MTFRNPVLFLATLCVGCSPGDAGSAWTGSVTDSAGVTIVSNSNEGVWSDADRWTVEQDLVIGAIEGDPNYLFGRIAGICVGSERQIYVLDAEASRVTVYDPAGVFQYSFGEKGEGPGQLGNLVGPCLTGPGDSLYIPDLQNVRLNRFASDGSFGGSHRIDILQGIPVGWDVMADGRIVQQLRYMGMLGRPLNDSLNVVVVREADGSVSDTLLAFLPGGTISVVGMGGVAIAFFATEPNWEITPDGDILYGSNGDYRIERRDPMGNLKRVVTKQFEPQPIGESDRRVVRGAAEDFFRQSGIPEPMISQAMESVRVAEFFPAYHQFRSGPQGSLWVQRVIRPSELSEEERGNLSAVLGNLEAFLADPHLALGSPDWDVFDSDGRLLGVVTLPARFTPMKFVGEEVYGVWKDELEVNYVMRLKVVMKLP